MLIEAKICLISLATMVIFIGLPNSAVVLSATIRKLLPYANELINRSKINEINFTMVKPLVAYSAHQAVQGSLLLSRKYVAIVLADYHKDYLAGYLLMH